MGYVSQLRSQVGTCPLILTGTSVLILDEHRRLLLMERADTGGWGLPGGIMEPGESLEETGRREVSEELGVELTDLNLFGVFSGREYFYRYPNGDQVFNVTAAYLASFPADAVVALEPTEALQAVFFDVTSLPADIIRPELPIVDAFVEQVQAGRPLAAARGRLA